MSVSSINIVVTMCDECERPWGVILPRGYDENDELRAERAMLRMWDSHPDHLPPAPPIEHRDVVRVHEGDARWFEELGLEAPPVGWADVDRLDAPAWWLNKRRHRAVCWNCCGVAR